MINFIFNRLENFKNVIKEEIKNICTDEYNENLKKLSNLLNEFNFNNDENKFNEMFTIFNQSILKLKVFSHKNNEIKSDLVKKEKILEDNKEKKIKEEEKAIKEESKLKSN